MTNEPDPGRPTPTRRAFLGSVGPAAAAGYFGSRPSGTRTYTRAAPSESGRQPWSAGESAPDRVLEFPDDPFIVAAYGKPFLATRAESRANWEPSLTHQGYEATTLPEKVRTMFGLHPDALDTHTLDGYHDGQPNTPQSTLEMLWFSKRTGLPAAGGDNFGVRKADPEVAADRYGPVMERNGWRFPDGRPLENPTDLFAQTFDEQRHAYNETANTPSAFAPGTLDLIVLSTVTRLRQGFAGFWADGGVGLWLRHGLDFSVWATAAFRDHLSTLPPNRIAELGIDDPETFDIVAYLEAEDLTPESGDDPRTDPVFREYLLHHHLGIKRFFEAYRTAVEQRFPERMGGIKLWTNQFMGNFEAPQAANVYVSDSFDVMHPEISPTVQPGVGFKYRLLSALGRFSKPVIADGRLTPFREHRIDAFDPAISYRMLQRFLMAEAYANGALFEIILTSSGPHIHDSFEHWVQADGTVPEELQTFIDFLWAHRRFLEGGESDARCAVVWSLPTRLWRYEPQWGFGGADWPKIESFVGTTRLLREAQTPYDVLVFGHPRLWEDADQLERLSRYDAVVLPGVECLSDDQRATLETYLDEDGSVITSGPPPDRTEDYLRNDAVDSLFEQDGVTVLSDDPGLQRAVLTSDPSYQEAADGSSDGSLIAALRGLGVGSLAPEADRTLAVNRRSQPDASRTIVHLLNYDYTPEVDEFTAKRDVALELSKPDHDIGIARYHSPQGIEDLGFTIEQGEVQLVVPEVVEWGFVVLAPSSEALVERSAQAEAQELVAEADRRIADAEATDRDWGPDYVRGTVELEAARTALEFEAYSQAVAAAETSIEAVGKTYPRPVVGIDVAHGQPGSLDRSAPFEWLDENFDGYHFERLQDWEQSTLEAVDVVFVPPVLGGEDASFGFAAAELDRLDRFVSGGGSLVIFARGGVAGDVDSLTEQFGYRFDGAPIVFPEGVYGDVSVTSAHPLMRRVNAVTARFATPLERVPADADVLASIPEESGSWVSSEPPRAERSDGEESAAGVPIFAAGSHGDGWVVLLGQSNYLVNTREAQDFMEVMYELLTVLGRQSVSNRPRSLGDSTPSSSSHSTTASPPTSSTRRTTTDGQPGFSILIGVLGLLAGLASYVQRASADADEPE